MPERDIQQSYNRDEEQKPGAPPRSAHEPDGDTGSTKSRKTMTDPASGEPQGRAPEPNQAQTDEQPERRP